MSANFNISSESQEIEKSSNHPDKGGRFLDDVFKLVGGTLFSQLLLISTGPILTRLFPVEVFGATAIFVSIVNVFSIVACLRYDAAIMLPKEDDEAANLLLVSVVFTLIISLFSAALFSMFGTRFFRLLNATELISSYWFISITIFFTGISFALNNWGSRKREYIMLAFSRFTRSFGMTTYQLIAGFAGIATSGSMIAGNAIGQIFSSFILSLQVWKIDASLLVSSARIERMLSVVRRYRKFPLVDVWSVLINDLSWQLPVFLIASFFDKNAVGYYSLSYRIIQIPMAIIGVSIGQVFFQRTSVLKAREQDLEPTVTKVFKSLFGLGLFPSIILLLSGKELFAIIFGSEWAVAGTYVQILAIWFLIRFISSPLSSMFLIMESQEKLLIINLAILTTRFFSLYIGGINHDIYLALLLFSISGTIVYGSIILWVMNKVGINFGKLIKLIIPYIGFSLPTLGIFFLKAWISKSLWLMLIAGIIAAMIYYGLLIHHDPTILQELMKSIKKRSIDPVEP